MSTWREHPLCASPTPWPARFWGPERLDPTAWRELAGRLIIDDEIARLCAVLAGADRVHFFLDPARLPGDADCTAIAYLLLLRAGAAIARDLPAAAR